MAQQAGIPVITLFETVDQVNQALPEKMTQFFKRFVAIELESRVSQGAIIHTGRLQSLDIVLTGQAVGEFDLGFAKLRLPGLTTSIPFQFSKRRAVVADDLEPGADSWQFDLFLTDFTLVIDGLIGASPVRENGTTPRHLVPIADNPPVAFTGSAAFRIERAAPDKQVITRFIDVTSGSDPFLPDALSGGVVQVTCSPPYFLCGSSGFGFALRDILYDSSERYSPPMVINRGQSASWVGFALREATVYTPPAALGTRGFSATLRDFLIGNPLGLQGEIEVQFGRSPMAAATFVFEQDGSNITSGFDPDASTLDITAKPGERIDLEIALTVPAPPAGDPDGITDYKVEFKFPHAKDTIIADKATGSVCHGDVVEITVIEVIGTAPDAVEHKKPPVKVRMVASGTSPKASATLSGTDYNNIVELNGPVDRLNNVVLTAAANPVDPSVIFNWQGKALGIDQEGTTLVLSLPATARGIYHIELTEKEADNKGPTRIRIRVHSDPDTTLLMGCEAGVIAAHDPATPLSIAGVLGSYDLDHFHNFSTLVAVVNEDASLENGVISVPPGSIAEAAIDEGGVAATTENDRHVQLLFDFDTDIPGSWGDAQPFGGIGSEVHETLLQWAANYPGAKFQLIGRCDDVGTNSYNIELAARRAAAVLGLLTTAVSGQTALSVTDVSSFGERSIGTLLPGAAALITPDIGESSGWLIKKSDVSQGWPQNNEGNGVRTNPPNATREAIRRQFRRVDIYAVGGTPQGSSVRETSSVIDPTRRRVLVPAAGRMTLPSDNDNARSDYRVKLVVGWDRARFTGRKDLVPNLAELEYAWTPSEDGISATPEVMTIYGKWIYDDLTGFTEFTAGLKSDGGDGIARTDQVNLVAAFAFGPMLASGVDFDNDAIGSSVRLAALAALSGFASLDVGGGGGTGVTKTLIAAGSKSQLDGFESKTTTYAHDWDDPRGWSDPFDSFKTQFTISYSNELNINTGALGLHTTEPMKLRYDGIGVEFDNTNPAAPFLEKIGFVYESDSMTIEDSGLWKIEGPLQKLLRVTEFRMGVGSFWIEPTLAVAINIGVVEISEAAFRVTFNKGANGNIDFPPDFSLRGLSAKIDIPATLKGEGRLKIEEGGIIKAAIDVTVTPLKVRASAALAIGAPAQIAPAVFMNLYARVQFPGGIPLGSLPLAIHGFIGQTVINGERDISDKADIVSREIGWWRAKPEDKYRPKRGQHALGFGVVLGTLPDASFSLSIMGMVVVAFPDPEVILGVEVNLLKLPDTTAKDKKEGDSASITGLVVIDDEAVTLAVSAQYDIPKILSLKVPFGAYFPYPGSGKNVYVRLGADNVNGRTGEPITINILPTTINLKAWAYLMIEGGGITSLGGEAGWDFDGFAVGFGAGIGIEWKAGRIGLSASAKILVGFGTDPLIIKGGLFVDGKLDLVVVSISARGDIVLTYINPPGDNNSTLSLNGKFCGEVDMFFFSLKGCVDFSFGSPPNLIPPPPPKPIKSVSLTDRNGAIMGEATIAGSLQQAKPLFDFEEIDGVIKNKGVAPKDNHTVWPDTVPVLNFSHFIKDNLTNGQFDPDEQPASEAWFGSSRLKYAYRIDGVVLREVGGSNVTDPSGAQLQSAWTHSPSRAAGDTSGINGYSPSGAEVTHLQLLNWEPWAWARSSEEGGEGQPGDPITTIHTICEPVPEPNRACLWGSEAEIISLTEARLRRSTPAQGPYPSKFIGTGQAFIRHNGVEVTQQGLASILAAQGLNPRAGAVISTPNIVVDRRNITRGYRLPAAEEVTPAGVSPVALSWRANLNRDVTKGELILLVCQHKKPVTDDIDDCYMFEDVRIGSRSEHFSLTPFDIQTLDPRIPLWVSDRVDISRPADPRPGSDNKADMIISEPGATLKLKIPCSRLVFYYLRPGEGPVTFIVSHRDDSVTETVTDAPVSAAMSTILHSRSGIVAVEIRLKNKYIHLYRVCCLSTTSSRPATRRLPVDPDSISFPSVRSEDVDGDGRSSLWLGKPIQSFNLKEDITCVVLRYQMPARADAFDRLIVSPKNKAQVITLLSLCGVDERAALWRARDVAVRKDLADAITDNANGNRRPVLLKPDTNYEIEVGWSWQSWVGKADTDNAPETPPDSQFIRVNTPQRFRFRTAPEAVALSDLQDGANEYIFDPRDVDRYLVDSNPANAENFHFTDDPVVFHFSQAHINNLLKQYDRELDVEIRRTDPPAQSGGDISALITPLQGTLKMMKMPAQMLSNFERRINAAVSESPCLPGIDEVLGGVTLAGTFPLEPRVMYDVDLMARRISAPDDKVRVQASRFMTSRYANPTEMIEAFGMDTVVPAPVPVQELILDRQVNMPTDTLAASDRAFDQAMSAIGLDTLGLPGGNKPLIFQLWQQDATGSAFKMVGFLIDALEPIDREGAVISGGRVRVTNRCRLVEANVDGISFTVVRRTRNSTRILLVASSGFVRPQDAASFQLQFETSDGSLTGHQYIRTSPLVMEIEGF